MDAEERVPVLEVENLIRNYGRGVNGRPGDVRSVYD